MLLVEVILDLISVTVLTVSVATNWAAMNLVMLWPIMIIAPLIFLVNLRVWPTDLLSAPHLCMSLYSPTNGIGEKKRALMMLLGCEAIVVTEATGTVEAPAVSSALGV